VSGKSHISVERRKNECFKPHECDRSRDHGRVGASPAGTAAPEAPDDEIEVGELAELDRTTVSRAERGDNPTLLTIVRLLRVYGRLGALESFLPEPEVSPMARLEARQAGRRRRGNG